MAKKTLPQKLHRQFHQLNENGDIDGMDKLLKDNGIDINATLYAIEKDKEAEGGFFLFGEILKGKNIIEKIDYFIKEGADLEVKCNGVNALHRLYIRKDDVSIMQKLLESGLNVHQPNTSGDTLITKFVREYSNTIVDNYDDPDATLMYREKTDAEYALALRFIELLLKHGADPKMKNAHETSAADWLLHRKETGEWNRHHDILNQMILK